jgi:polysaccharide biosynthesis/export protein
LDSFRPNYCLLKIYLLFRKRLYYVFPDPVIKMNEMKKFSLYSPPCLLLTGMILLFLSSCVTNKQVKYLQRQQKSDTLSSFKNRKTLDYKIRPHDDLYIRIFSMDDKSNALFNKGMNSAGSASSNLGTYLDSYTVNDSGYVDFPLIGNVYVNELKVDEAKNLIQSLVREYLVDVQVTVKMLSFKVTFLGEVKRPGPVMVFRDKFNIFEGISEAGDLTDWAKRDKIAVIRQTKEGSRVYYMDLNSINILGSDSFYLEPNDIVYVPPLGIKRWGWETFPWGIAFGAVSTALLLINYFK